MSDYYLLLKSQMNDVFRADPVEFKWEEIDVGEQDVLLIHRLIHEPSGYFFSFDISDVTYSPGVERRSETFDARDWPSKLIKVPIWLRYLKREHEAPDLWGTLAQERDLLGSVATESDNSVFTAAEQEKIRLVINEIRAYVISSYNPTPEALRSLNSKLDYLIDGSKRLGRIHWKDIFVSTMIGIAVQLSLPGDQTHELLRFVGQLLRQILGAVLSLPTPR
jgi:hypothetical protein